MSTQVLRRRGTTAQHAGFIGGAGELTVDTDKNVGVIHNAALAGGFPLAGTMFANVFSQPQTISVLSGAPTVAFDVLVDGLSRFQVRKTGFVAVHRQEADTDPSSFELSKRGTTGNALAALSAGSGVGAMFFRGWDGAAMADAGSIRLFAIPAWTGANHGTKLFFNTVPSGSTLETTHATLDSTAFEVMSRLLLPNTTSSAVGGIYFGGNRAFHNFGTNNIFAGVNAGNLTMTGTLNSFFGVSSGQANTTGTSGSFFGVNAGFANTTGSYNSFFGRSAGAANTTGTYNSFFGSNAGLATTTQGNNSFFGTGAGQANTAIGNSFFGRLAGRFNTTGINNAFFGLSAGAANTTASSNSFFGASAGVANTTGTQNSFFGFRSGEANTTVGNGAFFGAYTGLSNTTGVNNSFFGARAGRINTTGYSNSFFGYRSGYSNTTAPRNAFFGNGTGQANTTGADNSFFGYLAGVANITGGSNAFFGRSAGAANTASYNSFFGRNAGLANTTGANNSFFGRSSGALNTTGSNNTLFGFQAGNNITTGSNNLVLGYDIDSPTATNSNTLTIGNLIFGTGVDGTGVAISSGNVGIGVITPLSRLHVGGLLRVDTGFFNDAGGFKHARVTTGSVGAGSTALVTITWATAFADTNYTVNASVLEATTSSLSMSVVHVESITAAAVTVRVLNNAVGSLTGTVHVIAVHD